MAIEENDCKKESSQSNIVFEKKKHPVKEGRRRDEQ